MSAWMLRRSIFNCSANDTACHSGCIMDGGFEHAMRRNCPHRQASGLPYVNLALIVCLSQKELAEIIGVPKSTISEIQSGKVTIYIYRHMRLFMEIGAQLTSTWEADHVPAIDLYGVRSDSTRTPIASRHIRLHHGASPLPRERPRIGRDESRLP